MRLGEVKDMSNVEEMAEIERLKLKKRPVAFRVRNTTGNAWVLFEHEDMANHMGELWGTQVQALYVRDGNETV